MDAVEPRVRFRGGYQGEAGGVHSHEHCAICAPSDVGPFQPILFARAAWSDDPRLNSFFATADDVPACLGRSNELRAFFDDPANREVQEAYALLGMKKDERTVLALAAPRATRSSCDVAQVTVGFSEHRLIAPCRHARRHPSGE